jgi:hypothetical protein
MVVREAWAPYTEIFLWPNVSARHDDRNDFDVTTPRLSTGGLRLAALISEVSKAAIAHTVQDLMAGVPQWQVSRSTVDTAGRRNSLRALDNNVWVVAASMVHRVHELI